MSSTALLHAPQLTLITGMSGSGKSVALRLLEDSGATCVDNLPLRLLPEFVGLMQADGRLRLGVAIDVRTPGDIGALPAVLEQVRREVSIQVLFLDASDDALLRRYSESRRPHPLSWNNPADSQSAIGLTECIRRERGLLEPLREIALQIDTSHLVPAQLRAWVADALSTQRAGLLFTIESFSFKRGVPSDADLVFDARCLPNPFYVPSLRTLTGRDESVVRWLEAHSEVSHFIDDVERFVMRWLPAYQRDMRSYLTVAIGCTGGQHRSVHVAEVLAQRLSIEHAVTLRHHALPIA